VPGVSVASIRICWINRICFASIFLRCWISRVRFASKTASFLCVRSLFPSIQSHRGTEVVCPYFQPMRFSEGFYLPASESSRSCPPPLVSSLVSVHFIFPAYLVLAWGPYFDVRGPGGLGAGCEGGGGGLGSVIKTCSGPHTQPYWYKLLPLDGVHINSTYAPNKQFLQLYLLYIQFKIYHNKHYTL
jgi:hypothetical protein